MPLYTESGIIKNWLLDIDHKRKKNIVCFHQEKFILDVNLQQFFVQPLLIKNQKLKFFFTTNFISLIKMNQLKACSHQCKESHVKNKKIIAY